MGDTRQFGKELGATLKLAIPIMGGQVGQILMELVDTVMVGKVGVIPLAGAAFANALFNVAFVFGIGILTSVGVLTSQAHGGREDQTKIIILRSSIWLSIFVGVILATFLTLIQPGLTIFRQPVDVLTQAKPFLVIISWSLVPAMVFMSSKIFSESSSQPWVPMVMVYLGVAFNVFLNWIFIFGNLGAPALGLVGAGWGTFIARIITGIGTLWYCLRVNSIPLSALLPFGISLAMICRMVRIGLPVGCQYLLEVGAFAFAAVLMGWISTAALASHQIAITCTTVTFMFPLGIAQAVSARVGQAVGAGSHSLTRIISASGLSLSFLVMSLFAVNFLLFGKQIAHAFNGDPEVVRITFGLLIVAGFFQLADGIQATAGSALRGMADVQIPMIFAFISYWIIAIPVGYLVAFVGRLGATGIWLGLALGLFVAATAITTRLWWLTRCSNRFTSLVGSRISIRK